MMMMIVVAMTIIVIMMTTAMKTIAIRINLNKCLFVVKIVITTKHEFSRINEKHHICDGGSGGKCDDKSNSLWLVQLL